MTAALSCDTCDPAARRGLFLRIEGGIALGDENMLRGFAAQLVRGLWRTDYLSLRLPAA